jgi:Glycosyltransferase family 87
MVIRNVVEFPQQIKNRVTILGRYRTSSFPFDLGYLGFSILLSFYYTKNGLGNDLSIFFEAGNHVVNSENPYGQSQDLVNSAYLNGPLTAIFLAVLSLLPKELLYFATIFFSLLLIPLIINNIKSICPRFFCNGKEFGVPIASVLIAFSFPIRATLIYGQLTIIYLYLFSFILVKLSETNSLFASSGLGVIVGASLDFKPHIYLLPSLFLVIKRIWILPGVMIYGFISYSFFEFFIGVNPYQEWFGAMRTRAMAGYSGADLMGISAVLRNQIYLEVVLIFAVLLGTVLQMRGVLYKEISYKITHWQVIAVFFCLLIQPFIHPQDLIWASFLIPFMISEDIESSKLWNFKLIICGQLFLWSYSWAANCLVIIIIIICIRLESRSIVKYSILCVPIIFAQIVQLGLGIEFSVLIRTMDYFAVIFSFLLVHGLYCESQKNKSKLSVN